MFECACDVGFELLEDGYSCRYVMKEKIQNKRHHNFVHSLACFLIICSKTRNISLSSSSESNLDEDYNSSDVFYEKGVSFSAKLDDTETYETNQSSSIVDTLPDNQPKDLTSFESKTEPNETFVPTTNNNNNFNIPRFYQTSHLAFHPLKGKKI